METYSLKKKNEKLGKELKGLTDALSLSEQRTALLLGLQVELTKPLAIRTTSSAGKPRRVATAVAMASDWHVEERVDPHKVGGKNEYNLRIAKRRIGNFFDGVLWLVNHHRHSFVLDNLVLWLGGDIITGYIHKELEETNLLSPTEAILFAAKEIQAGIELLQKEVNLSVVCNFGNHGRTTIEKKFISAAENNYEWLMYHMLAQAMPTVTFRIASSHYVYVTVENHRIRFGHGDTFSGGAGLGGPALAILKGIRNLQLSEPADYTCCGHFHTYADLGGAVCNGSLIGYSPFSQAHNYAIEPPQQAFFLVDRKYGKCMSTPVIVER